MSFMSTVVKIDLNALSLFLGLVISVATIGALVYNVTIKPYNKLKSKIDELKKENETQQNEIIELKAQFKSMSYDNTRFQTVTVHSLQAICQCLKLEDAINQINEYLINK